jgi:hypothetical protein
MRAAVSLVAVMCCIALSWAQPSAQCSVLRQVVDTRWRAAHNGLQVAKVAQGVTLQETCDKIDTTIARVVANVDVVKLPTWISTLEEGADICSMVVPDVIMPMRTWKLELAQLTSVVSTMRENCTRDTIARVKAHLTECAHLSIARPAAAVECLCIKQPRRSSSKSASL